MQSKVNRKIRDLLNIFQFLSLFTKPRAYDKIMMTSSNANIFRVTGHSPLTSEFPEQRLVTRSFDVFIDLRLNKRLSKLWWSCWFQTPWRPLWCHYYAKAHTISLCIHVFVISTRWDLGRFGSNFKSVICQLIMVNSTFDISSQFAGKWIPQKPINEKSSLHEPYLTQGYVAMASLGHHDPIARFMGPA